MGAGAVTALLLGGAWFRYSLLWIIVAMAPFIIVSVNTASRIGALNREGLIELFKRRLHPIIAWIVLIINIPVHFLVIMGQVSVMTSSLQSLAGTEGSQQPSVAVEVALSLGVAAAMLWLILSRGYGRVQSVMSALMLVMFFCFLAIAVRGFSEIGAIAAGFVPSIPPDLPVPGENEVRLASSSIVAIIGAAIAPAALLGMPYLTADAGTRPDAFSEDLRRTILNLGIILGAYSIFIIVAGGYALFPRADHAAIDTVGEAGRVLEAAFPPALSAIGPLIFTVSLFIAAMTTAIVAAQVCTYILLDGLGKNWRYTPDNRPFFYGMAFFIVGPAAVAPLWDFPALLKIVLLMGLNVVVIPIVLAAVILLANRKDVMQSYTAGWVRNGMLMLILVAALALGFVKLPGYWATLTG